METPPADTKTRILDAAERLFAEHGVAGISLRAVTAAADVNLAAVNYHFGAKEALVGAVVHRLLDGVNATQIRLLDEREARPHAPTVEDLLVAFAAPIFAFFDAHRGRDWGQAWMYAYSMGGPRHVMVGGAPRAADAAPEVVRRYLTAFARALPAVPVDELRWRFERMTSLLMANQGKQTMPAYADATDRARQDERAWLIAFLAGALRSPATPRRD